VKYVEKHTTHNNT